MNRLPHLALANLSVTLLTVLDSAAGLPCAAAGFSNVTQVRLGIVKAVIHIGTVGPTLAGVPYQAGLTRPP